MTINTKCKIKKLFKSISEDIHKLLEVYNDEKIKIKQLHEDAIGSIILKRLIELQTFGLKVEINSLKTNESKTGIDFDIWIGENDSKFFRLYVQAKSLKNETKVTGRYTIKKEQCKKLIEHAKNKHCAYPMYFLYQYIKDEDLKKKHFKFLKNFKNKYSSITFASAHNIAKLVDEKKIAFADIHKNNIEKSEWKNPIFDLFKKEEKNIGLPFYLLYDLTLSNIEKFQAFIGNSGNCLGFFFFFFFGEDFPFKIHKITSEEIIKKYSVNDENSDVQRKNLIIINYNKFNKVY